MDFQFDLANTYNFLLGTLILKLGGRRLISQMTIPQPIIKISIGTLLIQPVTRKRTLGNLGIGVILILCLKVTEYIQLKNDRAETAISGKAVPVIEYGTLN
ncbi:hypothetical protein V7122_00170 [Bacillus sp. JJ1532]|uniref:hypothetical protein n=1 Tax=unclassified Bacillus (in: firmicutes) TaxID=185979 RepID=UPI002FFDF16C